MCPVIVVVKVDHDEDAKPIKHSVLLHDDDGDDDDGGDDQYHGIKRSTFARESNYSQLLFIILSRNTVT